MDKDVNKELEKQDTLITGSPDAFQILSVAEGGRKYKTTYTKKFENRPKWVKPNPEEIKSFLPGTVEKIMVKVGETVKEGDELMFYVAMKMHNIIRAPFDGKIEDIRVKQGDRIPKGIIMLLIKEKKTDTEKKKKDVGAKVQKKNVKEKNVKKS